MKPKLQSWSKTYTQDPDTCADDDLPQCLVLEQDDGGGGSFWIIKTERWAFDSLDEVIDLLEAAGVERRAAPKT